jgi:rubrerythrin
MMNKLTVLEKYIQQMSEDAESENYHEICGLYQQIADALLKVLSPEMTLKVMKDIGSLMR